MTVRARLVLAVVGLLLARPGAFAQVLKERPPFQPPSVRAEWVGFSPDGKVVAAASRGLGPGNREKWGELRLWDLSSGRERGLLKAHDDAMFHSAFSPDGKLLVTGGYDYKIKLWDITADDERITFTERATLRGPGIQLRLVAFSRDGKRFGFAAERWVEIWDVAAVKKLSSFTLRIPGWTPAFSPDLDTLAWPDFEDVDLWDTATGKERATLPDHRGAVTRAAFTADGKTLAAASYRFEEGGKYFSELRLWDVASGKELTTLRGHVGFLSRFVLSPDGKTVALLGADELRSTPELKLLDVASGRVLGAQTLKGAKSEPLCLAISPDGKVLAAGCADGAVRLWDFVLPAEQKPGRGREP